MRPVRRWSAAVAIVITLVLIAAIGLHYGGVDLEPLLVSTGFRKPHRTDLSHDFDFNHFHYDVRVEPQSNRLACDGTLSLTAKIDNARVLYLLPMHFDRDYISCDLTDLSPSASVEMIDVRPYLSYCGHGILVWRIELDEGLPQGEEVALTFKVTETVTNRYPGKRLWYGIVPRGVYRVEWFPWVPGEMDWWGNWPYSSRVTATIEVPEDFVLVHAERYMEYEPMDRPGVYEVTAVRHMWGNQLYAGPYVSRTFEFPVPNRSDTLKIHAYAFSEESLKEYGRWAGQALAFYQRAFGMPRWFRYHPQRNSIVMLEIPKEHGGGFSHEGLVGIREGVEGPGLSRGREGLMYHELGHQWSVVMNINGPWRLNYESLTMYKEFLVFAGVYGQERALHNLNELKDRYLQAAAEYKVPAIAQVSEDRDDPVTTPVAYYKGCWLWHSLRFMLGDDDFFDLLRQLYEIRRSLTHEEFQQMIVERSSEEVALFVDQYLQSEGLPKLAYTDLSSNPEEDSLTNHTFRTRFSLLSLGDVHPPRIEVELTGEEGQSLRKRFDIGQGRTEVTLVTDFRVVAVALDPDQWLLATTPAESEIAAFLRWEPITRVINQVLAGMLMPTFLLGLLLLLVGNAVQWQWSELRGILSIEHFRNIPLATKLNILIPLAFVPITGGLMLIPGVWGGRLAVLSLVALGLSIAAGSFYAHRRYFKALVNVARETGAEVLVSPMQEKDSPVCIKLKRWLQSDLYLWKVGGRFPFVVGTQDGFIFIVRAPYAVRFEGWKRDTTRIAIYHRASLGGFTIYSRDRVPPKASRLVPVGNREFDSRFIIVSRRLEEVKNVMTEAAQAAVKDLDGTGVAGIEVTRWGVFYHLEGKVTDPEQVLSALPFLLKLARELAAAFARKQKEG